jgi:hypothetical protein
MNASIHHLHALLAAATYLLNSTVMAPTPAALWLLCATGAAWWEWQRREHTCTSEPLACTADFTQLLAQL